MPNILQIGYLIADRLTAAGLDALLAQCTLQLEITFRCQSVVDCEPQQDVDVIIIDDLVPVPQSADIIAKIRQRWGQTPIVAVCGVLNEFYISTLLRSNVLGCLYRQELSADLLQTALENAVQQQVTLSPAIASISFQFDDDTGFNLIDIDVLALTAKGFAVAEISDILQTSRRTVYRSLARLRKYFNVRHNTELTAAASQRNLL